MRIQARGAKGLGTSQEIRYRDGVERVQSRHDW